MSRTKGPQFVIWLLTAKCNLSCSHCYTDRFPGEDELTEEQALALVEDMARSGVKRIGFTGGEIFLRKDALRIVKRAFQLGIEVGLVSNGSLLTEEVARALADCQAHVLLSIDGARQRTHEMIRGSGTWESVTAAVEDAVAPAQKTPPEESSAAFTNRSTVSAAA